MQGQRLTPTILAVLKHHLILILPEIDKFQQSLFPFAGKYHQFWHMTHKNTTATNGIVQTNGTQLRPEWFNTFIFVMIWGIPSARDKPYLWMVFDELKISNSLDSNLIWLGVPRFTKPPAIGNHIFHRLYPINTILYGLVKHDIHWYTGYGHPSIMNDCPFLAMNAYDHPWRVKSPEAAEA